MQMSHDLEGKVALVTGAAGGIGSVTARLLAGAGAKLALVDRDEVQLRKLAKELVGAGAGEDQVHVRAADVTRSDDVRDAVSDAVSVLGGLDVVFNNAGIEGVVARIEDYDEATFDEVLRVNVTGVWLTMKFTIPALRDSGGGSIINTSSGLGLVGLPGLGAYVASKHAVLGLTRTAALELAGENVRVNAICPGPIGTRMMDSLEQLAGLEEPNAARELYESVVPMKRYGTPEEVAQLVYYLASDASSYVTGAAFPIDGGVTAA